MTSRADLPRLGASLGVLGTLLERDGQTAYDAMAGWQHGPRKAPQTGERGGGGGEAGQEDRKDEVIQRARAARHFAAFTADLDAIDALAQSLIRRMDVACPPNPNDVKNRVGEFDPITPAEAAIEGWCRSCWRNDQDMVPITVQKKSGLRYYRDLCRWCGDMKHTYGIEPPLEMVRLNNQIPRRHIPPDVMAEAVKKAKQAAAPKGRKKAKRRKAKQAA